MACGHISNSTIYGKPFCVICSCETVAVFNPDLTGRKATCNYCGKLADSSFKLPLFDHKPNSPYDKYYCGCFGWD